MKKPATHHGREVVTAKQTTVHFSSAKENWATPPELFNALHREFKFATDVCAEAENAKLPHYFDKATDGLKQAWSGVCWMNPPYGRKIGRWMQKAYESSQAGATVVCLVPARMDTRWWHTYCTRADEIRYINGRVEFISEGIQAPAPFPSAVVIFSSVNTEIQSQKRMVWSKITNRYVTVALRANRPILTNKNGATTLSPRKFRRH